MTAYYYYKTIHLGMDYILQKLLSVILAKIAVLSQDGST